MPVYIYLREGYTGDLQTTEVYPGVMLDKTPTGELIGIEVIDYVRIIIEPEQLVHPDYSGMFVRMCVCNAKTDVHGPNHSRNCTMYKAANE